MRFANYKEVGWYEKWKKNQTKSDRLKSQPIDNHIFLVNSEERKKVFGKRIASGETIDGEEKEYIAIHSFYPMLQEDTLEDIIDEGIPVIISSTEYEDFMICWEKSSVMGMKSVCFKHLDEYNNRLFIHDNYEDVVALQEAIENDKKGVIR